MFQTALVGCLAVVVVVVVLFSSHCAKLDVVVVVVVVMVYSVVPTAKDFVDIILSMTQRKTPTVVHKNFKIGRIRSFYMRKVKFTQQNYHDRLTKILDDFPRLEDIHPFYRDLMNVLYSKDHYKLALGQLHTARTLLDNLGKDYVRLLKFADSLYRCKELKRAALGRYVALAVRCQWQWMTQLTLTGLIDDGVMVVVGGVGLQNVYAREKTRCVIRIFGAGATALESFTVDRSQHSYSHDLWIPERR